MRYNLTAQFVESIKAPRNGKDRETFWDEKTAGFGLRVTANGARTWVALYRHGGRLRWLTLGSYPVMPLADARANAKNALNAAQNGSDPAGEKQAKRATDETVKEFGEKWIESINMAVKSRTAKSYEQLFRLHVVPALGSYILRDVTVRQIKDLLTRKRAGYSKNTVRLIHACVRSLFADALDDGLVSANPAVSLQRHRSNTVSGLSATERVAAIRPFTDDELARLLHVSSANRAYHPLFLTLARTGMRPGEAFALRWSDINFEKREILIERALSDGKIGTTKTETNRRADMSRELAVTLKALETSRKEEALKSGWREVPELVFINGKANHVDESRVRKHFAKIMAAAMLSGHRLYDLRHTFATLHLAKGHPITWVAAQLGHAKPTTTLQWYAHWLPSVDKKYIDALDTTPNEAGVIGMASARERA